MALTTWNIANIDYQEAVDGWTLSGGSTSNRSLTLTGGDVTLTGGSANTYTFPSATTTLVGTDSAQALSNKSITLVAGTTSAASLKFTSGSLLTSAAAGNIEYDGKVFYATPQAAERGYIQVTQMTIVQADFTLANATGVQAVFPAAQDTFTLSASTTYMFEGFYYLTTGTTTTHTTSVAFGGTATLTNILYDAECVSSAASTIATSTSRITITTAASTVLNATSTAATTKIWLWGVVRINAGGTFIPQIAFSAAPGTTNLTKINSWFRLWPAGTNTVASIGTPA